MCLNLLSLLKAIGTLQYIGITDMDPCSTNMFQGSLYPLSVDCSYFSVGKQGNDRFKEHFLLRRYTVLLTFLCLVQITSLFRAICSFVKENTDHLLDQGKDQVGTVSENQYVHVNKQWFVFYSQVEIQKQVTNV